MTEILSAVTELTTEACWDLLRSHQFGRLALTVGGEPEIFPINYTVQDGTLVFRVVPSELAPPEDRGVFFASVVGPEGAGFDYTVAQMKQVEAILAKQMPDGEKRRRAHFLVDSGSGFARAQGDVSAIVRALAGRPGLRLAGPVR